MSKKPSLSKPAASTVARLRITLIKSPVGNIARQKRTVRALGFHRLHETVEQPDSLVTRGMLAKVAHLVKIEEIK
jgi:large subunit ribosomal protein L30